MSVADVIGQLVQLASNCGGSDLIQTNGVLEKGSQP